MIFKGYCLCPQSPYFYCMKLFAFLLIILLPVFGLAQKFSSDEISSWKQQAQNVTIIRDNWGIPHIYGKTDADAVFGLLYAQCEDDFPRVEANYIEKLGRQSEIKGRRALYEDLLHRLVLDSAAAKKDFSAAPVWMKKLCNAYADGINYYLATHPEEKPALLTRFQPWWPFMWTDGSIGAISTGGATQQELQSFYSGEAVAALPPRLDDENEIGSNGFAFSPKLTQSGKAILYINPHVTFYFRPEVHMVSEEGLNAYGAVTWGQFFIYQGFNEACGWMHTSSQADVADLYAEKVQRIKGKFEYLYKGKSKPVVEKEIIITVNDLGTVSKKSIKTFETHHGPVIAKRNGEWLALKHHNRSAKGLEQSWLRTKAKSFAEFKQVMYMKENTSNNTVYADREGNIAYWHGNFMPKRDTKLDWSKPVDGSTSKTEWGPLHMVDDMVTIYNPKTGWIQNCNSTPATAAGESSLVLSKFPKYMAPDAENFRGINAVRHCLELNVKQLDIDKTIALGYTRKLPAMEYVVPALLKALKNTGLSNPDLKEAHDQLAAWKYETDTNCIASTLAIETAERMLPYINRTTSTIMNDAGFVGKVMTYGEQAPDSQVVRLLQATMQNLQSRFGKWQVPWGEINRYQRLTGQLNERYEDAKPSIPSRFAAATWGALPSYVSRPMNGSTKRFGYSGNSFICAVEFGDIVKAKSLLAGGNSNNPASPHFGDQAEMYTNGNFKEVLFYREDVLKNARKTYNPGL
jgi:acyl-homoserine-lactone acylase